MEIAYKDENSDIKVDLLRTWKIDHMMQKETLTSKAIAENGATNLKSDGEIYLVIYEWIPDHHSPEERKCKTNNFVS